MTVCFLSTLCPSSFLVADPSLHSFPAVIMSPTTIKLRNTHLKKYAEHLMLCGLAFEVEISQAGPTVVSEFSGHVAE